LTQFQQQSNLKITARPALRAGLLPVPKWRNWQTRMVQVHVLARVWGFESLLRHQLQSYLSDFIRNINKINHL
jgi:hypothetical protein